jgi:hypothetical protein
MEKGNWEPKMIRKAKRILKWKIQRDPRAAQKKWQDFGGEAGGNGSGKTPVWNLEKIFTERIMVIKR